MKLFDGWCKVSVDDLVRLFESSFGYVMALCKVLATRLIELSSMLELPIEQVLRVFRHGLTALLDAYLTAVPGACELTSTSRLDPKALERSQN